MALSLLEVLKDIQHAAKTLTIKDLEDLDNAELAQIIEAASIMTPPQPIKWDSEAT
jgi:hypothetical protein